MQSIKVGELVIPASNIAAITHNSQLEIVTVTFHTPFRIYGQVPGLSEDYNEDNNIENDKPVSYLAFEGKIGKTIWKNVAHNQDTIDIEFYAQMGV